jgi:hypothetical protein
MSIRRRVRACTRFSEPAKALTTHDYVRGISRPSTLLNKYTYWILANTKNDFLDGTLGSLTIVNLTDPVIDADSACVLFDICLSVFIQETQCRKIVALDKAHNYMAEGSGAAKAFTKKLLRTVREQQHQTVRVVIATQEPSINTQLLDLCSITMMQSNRA